jgi:hypothetical protein
MKNIKIYLFIYLFETIIGYTYDNDKGIFLSILKINCDRKER